eukprot:scaffold84970_cov31-Tisochrysis_lutea.AAC.1
MASAALLVAVIGALLPGPPQPARGVCSRRAALSIGTLGLALSPHAASAFFESPTQQAVQKLASALPRVESLITEVKEIERLRAKVPANYEDDAYVLRFGRSVLSPLAEPMAEAAAKMGGDAPSFSASFSEHLAGLDNACKQKDASRERAELEALQASLSGILDLGKGQKYNTQSREDINGYSGATGVLYNKFLFRAG